MEKVIKYILYASILLIIGFNFVCFPFSVRYWKAKHGFEEELSLSLVLIREHIRIYRQTFSENPILKNENIHFWDLNSNQAIWYHQFQNLENLATNPVAEKIRESNVLVLDKEKGKMVSLKEKAHLFLNPLTKRFDWLVESEDGKVYSPSMPDSVLIASPPIRVVNIRCPLTASDPPFFEDFTKW